MAFVAFADRAQADDRRCCADYCAGRARRCRATICEFFCARLSLAQPTRGARHELAYRADRRTARNRAPRLDLPVARRPAAAPSEVALGLDRVAGLVPRAPAERRDPVRNPRVLKATTDHKRGPGARTSPPSCRATAGGLSPAGRTGGSSRPLAAAPGGAPNLRRRHRASGSPPRVGAC